MKKTFVKMHGLGNDFAIFDGRRDHFDLTAAQAGILGDRWRGIGFDQAIIMTPSRTAGADIFMKIYNVDGTEVGACGNATRCVASLLMAESGRAEVVIETLAGLLKAWTDSGRIIVDMGPARLDWREIPLASNQDTLSLPLGETALGNPVAVNMGNPHAVFFVDDAADVALEIVGPRIENHPMFPALTNVEVAQVFSRGRIRMRVWERGTGITQACGTGACAVAVAGVRRNLTDRKVEIVLDGGTLHVEWRESDGHVLMTGPVATAYTGEVDV